MFVSLGGAGGGTRRNMCHNWWAFKTLEGFNKYSSQNKYHFLSNGDTCNNILNLKLPFFSWFHNAGMCWRFTTLFLLFYGTVYKSEHCCANNTKNVACPNLCRHNITLVLVPSNEHVLFSHGYLSQRSKLNTSNYKLTITSCTLIRDTNVVIKYQFWLQLPLLITVTSSNYSYQFWAFKLIELQLSRF